jgi:hypothetical protein
MGMGETLLKSAFMLRWLGVSSDTTGRAGEKIAVSSLRRVKKL